MSYEFTKLGAVEALTEMPDNANALVEVDGAIKRAPAGAGGGVFIVHGTTADMQSVTLDKTPDEAMAAAQAGQHVECHLAFNMGGVVAMTYILTMMYYGEADFGPSVAYGLNMSGSSIEINDGYSGNGSDPAERVTTISMIEA